MLRSEAAVGGVIRLSTVTEPDVPRQVRFAEATKHAQVGLEQGAQALRPILMDVTTGILLLGMIDELVHIAFHGPIAAGRVGVEPTACVHRDVRGLLDRLHREIFGCLDDDSPLATDPGNNGWPVFVVMAPAGLAFLAATTRLASQHLLPTPFGLPLVAGGMVEVIRFHRACQLAMHLIRQRSIPQPPAPPIAGLDMDPHLPRDTPRRTGETEQKGGQNPVRQRPLALVEEGVGEVVEGALAAVAPVAFASRSVVVLAPRIDVLALTPGTLQRAIFPSECMDIDVACVRVEELVEMGENGHS